jgi:hypothetical protein
MAFEINSMAVILPETQRLTASFCTDHALPFALAARN